jgi:uncharacterized membrane protein
LFSFLKRKPKPFFTADESKQIVEAIRAAEKRTSGEIRVFVESRCKYMDAIDRAVEIFGNLKMYETDDRNAVIVYLALRDRQLAVFGDEGIHQKVGNEYWQKEVALLLNNFNREDFAAGISQCVKDIGEALHYFFPYDGDTDKNELPDDIVFGK